MAPAAVQHQYLEGNAYLDCSAETAATVDREVQRILNKCYEEAKAILVEKRARLDEIASYLLVKETITGDEMMAYIKADQEQKEETE